jgi:hypothetical protein
MIALSINHTRTPEFRRQGVVLSDYRSHRGGGFGLDGGGWKRGKRWSFGLFKGAGHGACEGET